MSAARAQEQLVCENPGCEQRFKTLERDVEELQRALRTPEHGIFDTLKRLELQFMSFTSTVTASVRTTVFLGSAGGAILGAIAAALAIMARLR